MNFEVIKASVLFQNMNTDEVRKALDIFEAESVAYKKNDWIHRPYTKMKKFGLLLSGVVQVCVDDVDGNRMIMSEVIAGQTFGESICFLKIANSPMYIFASENCEVLWLSLEKLFVSSADEQIFKLQKRFTGMLAARTLNMNDRIQVLSKIKIRDKLMTYFSQQARLSGSLTFQLPVNRDDLATYIGTNRSALSREMSNMKKDGLIDYYKNTVKIIKQ